MHRGFPYPAVRAATNVALRSLGTSLVIQEMLRGTPVIYMDYTDYDEIAHHSGPGATGVARRARRRRPRAAGRCKKAAADAPRPYRFVDPRGPRPEPGRDLPAALRRDPPGCRALADGRPGVGRGGHGADRGLGPAQHVPGRGRRRRRASPGRWRGPSRATSARTGTSRWVRRTRSTRRPAHQHAARATRAPRLRPRGPQRRTARRRARRPRGRRRRQPRAHLLQRQQGADDASRQIEEHYPDLVQALANHPGIGVLIVRSAANGLICVGKDGIHYLDEERVEGEDPLAVYGEHAVAAVKRLDAIDHVGDIAVISHYDPETERDRRVRGAHRRPRRSGRRADASLPALSVRLGAGPRAAHRRADGLPAAAPLDGAGVGHAFREGWRRQAARRDARVGIGPGRS